MWHLPDDNTVAPTTRYAATERQWPKSKKRASRPLVSHPRHGQHDRVSCTRLVRRITDVHLTQLNFYQVQSCTNWQNLSVVYNTAPGLDDVIHGKRALVHSQPHQFDSHYSTVVT